MRLHRLELEGFGPFRSRQAIQFDAFDDDGIFLISGRTGAGKSSILDGVCFALYGAVPRYEGADKRIRSDYCAPDEPTQVRLEFSVAGTRWRVTRAPEYERPKARGEGLTTVPHAAHLEEHVGGEWIGRAAKPRDVALLLDEIVGLNQQQFLQVILLAQNRFAQFLLAKNDDRQALLRTLFGSRTYRDYQEALEQRRREASERLAGGAALVRHILDDADRLVAEHDLAGDDDRPPEDDAAARREWIERARQRAAYRAETSDRERAEAEARHTAAVDAHRALVAVRDKQVQRQASRAALAALEAEAPRIAGDRQRLVAARAAELLRDPIERAAASADAAERADDAVAAARAAWVAAGEDEGADAAALAARIDEMTGELARCEAAAARERELPALTQRVAEAETAVARLEEQRSALDARIAEFPDLRAALDAEITAQQTLAARLEPSRTALAAAQQRLAAAREAERLTEACAQAEAAHAAALADATTAAAAVAALLQRRLAGYAGELAAQLVDGEPCAVCGSAEHPRPAHADADPVTDETIDAAVAAKDAAHETERAASERARAARQELAAAAAQAGGGTSTEIAELVAGLEGEVALAAEAAQHVARLTADRRALAEAEAATTAERADVEQRLAAARADVVSLRQQASAARADVDAARGEFETVADRIAQATARRALARALADAVTARDTARAQERVDREERDRRVAESEFADVAAARDALLGTDDRAQLESRVRTHEVAHAGEVERLRALEIELAGTPDELVDLDAAAVLAEQAKQDWTAAVDRALRAAQAAEALQGILTRAQAAQADIADLHAEFELVAGLANAVSGRNARKMDLETFVLAAELEEIVAAANLRLDEMSSGRYLLRHTDALVGRGAAGLGLEVVDAYTGQSRPPQSLSGGETFLASLALALGLAQVVTEDAGGIRLDTLFIDEGFGSLDSETLELAMRTLDELRQGGRTVGVISHVEAMKEQLPAQLVVKATAEGPSIIAQDTRAHA